MNATTLILLLLVLACPLSMLFMHRGGGHSHGSRDGSRSSVGDSQAEGHGAHAVPPRDPSGDAVPVSEEGRHVHSGFGHGGGSRHEHPKSGAAA
jgi:hypothetical protein